MTDIPDHVIDAAWKAFAKQCHDDVYTGPEQLRAAGRVFVEWALGEAAAWFEGKGGVIPGASVFARLVSRNNQPCMSGDPRDRLDRIDRREFDEAMAYVAAAIRALNDKP